MSIDRYFSLSLSGTNPNPIHIASSHGADKTVSNLGRALGVVWVYIWKEMEYNSIITIILLFPVAASSLISSLKPIGLEDLPREPWLVLCF